MVLRAADDQADVLEIVPSVRYQGYWYVARFRDLDTDAAYVDFSRRPMALTRDLLRIVLRHFRPIAKYGVFYAFASRT